MISNYHPFVHVGADILVVALCAKALIENYLYRRKPERLPPFTLLFAFHFFWVLINIFHPYSLSLFSSVAGAKVYVSMFTLYFFGFYLVKSVKDVHFFIWPWIGITLVHTFTGVYQGLTGPDSVLALHSRYSVQLSKFADQAFRPFGLTNLPGAPAVWIFLVTPLVVYMIFNNRSKLMRVLMILAAPFLGLTLVLCQVRSAIFKTLFGVSMYYLGNLVRIGRLSWRRAAYNFALTSLLVGSTFYFLPQLTNYAEDSYAENVRAVERSLTTFEYDSMSHARRGAWERFTKYLVEVPFGAGLARVGAAGGAFEKLRNRDPYFSADHFFADNFWIASLVELGFPGMLLLTFILFGILIRGFFSLRDQKDPQKRSLQLAILSALTASVVGLYGAEGVLYNPESSFFWFFSGVLMRLSSDD
ncbi:MAG: hypothetical protein KDD59_05180 [Bdellovibrionales bacterium]|nr:hypothetical protein [Bdellovibrionales bacterium]